MKRRCGPAGFGCGVAGTSPSGQDYYAEGGKDAAGPDPPNQGVHLSGVHSRMAPLHLSICITLPGWPLGIISTRGSILNATAAMMNAIPNISQRIAQNPPDGRVPILTTS